VVHPLSQFTFVVELDSLPLRLEINVVHVLLELAQFAVVKDPLVCFEVFSV
jgi:hypothetical protein